MADPATTAALAAMEQLLALGVPEKHAGALSRAMKLGESVIDLVDARYRERAANPLPWAVFHETMRRSLRPVRFLARWHHQRMGKRYRAMVAAGTAIPCKAVHT